MNGVTCDSATYFSPFGSCFGEFVENGNGDAVRIVRRTATKDRSVSMPVDRFEKGHSSPKDSTYHTEVPPPYLRDSVLPTHSVKKLQSGFPIGQQYAKDLQVSKVALGPQPNEEAELHKVSTRITCHFP